MELAGEFRREVQKLSFRSFWSFMSLYIAQNPVTCVNGLVDIEVRLSLPGMNLPGIPVPLLLFCLEIDSGYLFTESILYQFAFLGLLDSLDQIGREL